MANLEKMSPTSWQEQTVRKGDEERICSPHVLNFLDYLYIKQSRKSCGLNQSWMNEEHLRQQYLYCAKRNKTERNETNRKEMYDLSTELPETMNTFYFSLSKMYVLLSALLYVIQYPYWLFYYNVD